MKFLWSASFMTQCTVPVLEIKAIFLIRMCNTLVNLKKDFFTANKCVIYVVIVQCISNHKSSGLSHLNNPCSNLDGNQNGFKSECSPSMHVGKQLVPVPVVLIVYTDSFYTARGLYTQYQVLKSHWNKKFHSYNIVNYSTNQINCHTSSYLQQYAILVSLPPTTTCCVQYWLQPT